MKISTIVLCLALLFPVFTEAQIICVNCYRQNDSISHGVHNLLLNGGFENTTCAFNSNNNTFCPNATSYNCDIANWTCIGGGAYTYTCFYNLASWFVEEGTHTVYFGNNFCHPCSSGTNDTSCLTHNGCTTGGLPNGFPTHTVTYGDTNGVSLLQTVSGLIPGNIYVLEFWTGGENQGNFTNDGMFAVNIGFGNTLLRCHQTGSVNPVGNRFVIQFRATAASHTIKFTNWGHICSTCTELMLDDVKLYTLAELSPSVPSCFIPFTATTVPAMSVCGQCNGSATCSTTNAAGTVTYAWSNGKNTANVDSLCAGNYSVTVTDSTGASVTSSVTITQGGALSLSAAAIPTNCGGNNGSASVNPIGNAPYTYLWNNGDTTAAVINAAWGTYAVTVSDATGCTGTASATVDSSQGNAASINSDKSIMCSSDSALICATSNAVAYLWNTGETTTCIHVNHAGNYYVTATDANGCTVVSVHLPVSTYPIPPVSISVNGDTLTSFNGSSYQWYLNGNAITNATDSVYVAKVNGFYTVAITDSNGCRTVSNPVNVVVNGVTSYGIPNAEFRIYPNPASDQLFIETNGAEIKQVNIYNTLGEIVLAVHLTTNYAILNTASLPAGVYIAEIKTSEVSVKKRWVKE